MKLPHHNPRTTIFRISCINLNLFDFKNNGITDADKITNIAMKIFTDIKFVLFFKSFEFPLK